MKKGQTQQVFIYIMVILIVGAILLFGYKSIRKIMNQSDDVDLATFQADLKDTLEKNSGYGDRYNKPIDAPNGYDALCFINSSLDGVDLSAEGPLNSFNQIMYEEALTQTGNNVFLIKGKETKVLYSLDFIVVEGNSTAKGFWCTSVTGGNFYMALEGIGKGKVKIASALPTETYEGNGGDDAT